MTFVSFFSIVDSISWWGFGSEIDFARGARSHARQPNIPSDKIDTLFHLTHLLIWLKLNPPEEWREMLMCGHRVEKKKKDGKSLN